MGNNNGLISGGILNQSLFVIEYVVSSQVQKKEETKIFKNINPEISVKLNVDGVEFSGSGFHKATEQQLSYFPNQSIITIGPDSFATSALNSLKPNECILSVRVRIGEYIKYLQKDVVIRDAMDCRLKIRTNLTVKNLDQDEAKTLYKKNRMISDKKPPENAKQVHDLLLNELQLSDPKIDEQTKKKIRQEKQFNKKPTSAIKSQQSC